MLISSLDGSVSLVGDNVSNFLEMPDRLQASTTNSPIEIGLLIDLVTC